MLKESAKLKRIKKCISLRGGLFLLLSAMTFLLVNCGGDPDIPKPRGYFRIAFPDKGYRSFDTTYPFSFDYPKYARVVPDTGLQAEPYWVNVDFPTFNGTLYLSYKKVNNNLVQYFEDTRVFVTKHISKADDIIPSPITFPENHVWGVYYTITGTGVASTCQFCVTDSTKHFLRGALYFNVRPNNDSLAPVLDFINKDIDRLISTIKWKSVP